MAEILIVEDDENIARMIEATLSMVGYRCDGCEDGSEAVRRILEGSYDLILLDVDVYKRQSWIPPTCS